MGVKEEVTKNLLEFAKYCQTEDPHDRKNPWKPFPIDKIPYLKTILDSYLTDTKVIVVKSRQVMLTWAYLVCVLWEVLFQKSSRIAVISKKVDDVRRLFDRIRFIYDRLPEWKPDAEFFSHPYPRVICSATHSSILGFPSGADQLRSETFSTIFADEFAFQNDQEEMYTASKPTVDGGGKIFLVSTPNGQNNTFYRLTQDTSFKVHRIHYSMNPYKDKVWREKAFQGMKPEAIAQEYELSFLSTIQDRAYNEFSLIHIKEQKYDETQPLYVSWDWGYRRPAVVFLQTNGVQVRILRSILGRKEVLDQFADRVLEFQLKEFSPAPNVIIDYSDIAGNQTNPQTGISDNAVMQQKLNKYGRLLRSRKVVDMEDTLNLVRKKMTELCQGEPAFVVDPSNQILIDAFMGGLHYHKAKQVCGCGTNEFGETETGYYKHLCDCVNYFFLQNYSLGLPEQNNRLSALPKRITRDQRECIGHD